LNRQFRIEGINYVPGVSLLGIGDQGQCTWRRLLNCGIEYQSRPERAIVAWIYLATLMCACGKSDSRVWAVRLCYQTCQQSSHTQLLMIGFDMHTVSTANVERAGPWRHVACVKRRGKWSFVVTALQAWPSTVIDDRARERSKTWTAHGLWMRARLCVYTPRVGRCDRQPRIHSIPALRKRDH